MNLTVGAIKIAQEGTGKNGEKWTRRSITFPAPVEIFEPSGTKYTFTQASTFDGMAAALQPGSVFECETEIAEKDGKRYLNLKKIDTNVGGQAPVPAPRPQVAAPLAGDKPHPAKNPPVPTPTVGRPLDTNDRIAEQVAVKAVVDLMAVKVIGRTEPLAVRTLQWISDHLPPAVDSTEISF